MSFDNFRVQRYLYCKTVCVFTIWLGPRANMIKQILGSDKLGGGGGGDCPQCPAKKNFCWTDDYEIVDWRSLFR